MDLCQQEFGMRAVRRANAFESKIAPFSLYDTRRQSSTSFQAHFSLELVGSRLYSVLHKARNFAATPQENVAVVDDGLRSPQFQVRESCSWPTAGDC